MFKLLFPYYRNETGNMGPYYPFKGCAFDIHAPQTHHAHCAMCVFALNAHFRIFLDLKLVIRFNIAWLSTNMMEIFMSTKWYNLVLNINKYLYNYLPISFHSANSPFLYLQIIFFFHSNWTSISWDIFNQFSTWAGPMNHSARYPYLNCIDGIEQQTNKISVKWVNRFKQ